MFQEWLVYSRGGESGLRSLQSEQQPKRNAGNRAGLRAGIRDCVYLIDCYLR